MSPTMRPFWLVLLLISIGMRTVLGAPCCWSAAGHGGPAVKVPVEQAGHGTHEHGHHEMAAASADEVQSGHGDHSDGPTANPCCSACGPTLPSDPVQLALVRPDRTPPEPEVIRALATRPPFPAYDATGPPLKA